MTSRAGSVVLAETCATCGQEVRHGVRDERLGWWHRDVVDHNPLFGTPTASVDWEAIEAAYQAPREGEDGEIYSAASFDRAKMKKAQRQDEDETEFDINPHDIPPPEVTATPIDVGDERLPGGAKQILKLARKHGWTAWATYSRAARVHSTHGTLLGISDYVVLRMRLDGSDRRAVGSWTDGKFSYAYNLTAVPDQQQYLTKRANSDALKSWIRGE